MTLVWIALCALFIVQLQGCGGDSSSPVAAIVEDTVEDALPDALDISQDIDAPSDLELDSSPPSQEPCPQERAWGCACTSDTECDSGACVAGPESHLCAGSCEGGCPEGWRCAGVASDEGVGAEHCIPNHAALCRPCETDADCTLGGDPGASCITHGELSGAFCGAPCDEASPCPDGYGCEEPPVGEEGSGQCVPSTPDSCGCGALAKEAEASTPCSQTNEYGTCAGHRACSEEGLSECTAAIPTAEVCDGEDNDCDGDVDEDLEPLVCGHGLCQKVVEICVDGATVSCDEVELADPSEETCNGLDDDCDGETDEEQGSVSCGIGLCETTVPACVQGTLNSCEPLFQPGEIAETCNGVDDDCDGETDEDLTDCDSEG